MLLFWELQETQKLRLCVEYKFRCHMLQPLDFKVVNIKSWIYMCTEWIIEIVGVWHIKFKTFGKLTEIGMHDD